MDVYDWMDLYKPFSNQMCDICKGPGYAGPLEAMKSEKEKLLYVPLLPEKSKSSSSGVSDYIATVDIDPESPTYCKVVHRLPMLLNRGELHHMGWNACSSSHHDATKSRRFLVVPNFASGDITIVDTSNSKEPKLHKMIPAEEIKEKTGLTWPHTVHCLGNGDIMISMLGDDKEEGIGAFLVLNDKFEIMDRWEAPRSVTRLGYDFWYQPYHDVMVSSEFGPPRSFSKGFNKEDLLKGEFGSRLYFWKWSTHEVIQTIELGQDGQVPLEVRFMHSPKQPQGFVGCALSSTVIRFYLEGDKWKTETVIKVSPKEIDGWLLPQVPGLITDILISMDDRFLYFSNWLQGDVRQYDISNPSDPKLVGQVFLGGIIKNLNTDPETIKGVKFQGGPQMLQLSLDGKRLYVTNSLFSTWDRQFYPEMIEKGSQMVQIDVNTDTGGLEINQNFMVDFGNEPYGPALAHEVRFPGGDCTSDIWYK